MKTADEYQVYIPKEDSDIEIFSSRNVAIIAISFALLYLIILILQVCFKSKRSDRYSELSESFVTESGERVTEGDSYSYYYGESEYTNSQYLKSDDRNSLVDHKHFRYDQSLRDGSSIMNGSSRDGGSSVHDEDYQDDIGYGRTYTNDSPEKKNAKPHRRVMRRMSK